MKNIVIAIDGFSGTGKSSTAKEVAEKLGYTYIDSGAMYRATTLFFLQHKVDIGDKGNVQRVLDDLRLDFETNEILINNQPVSDQIRTMQVNDNVSHVAALKEVRVEMVKQQQLMGKSKRVVMDGRDIGTVVFPQAELKVFMTANVDVRAARRQKELEVQGVNEELSVIKSNLIERDRLDSSRKESPLIKAEGAIEIDTSYLSFEDQVSKIVDLAKAKIHGN
ncbi:MAG: (d)CMP kinase [Cyclobacteriaceae bacterium]